MGSTLNLNVGGIPEGQTFHLRQSGDLATFNAFTPAIDFDSTTPQPIAVPINPAVDTFLQVYQGATPQ